MGAIYRVHRVQLGEGGEQSIHEAVRQEERAMLATGTALYVCETCGHWSPIGPCIRCESDLPALVLAVFHRGLH